MEKIITEKLTCHYCNQPIIINKNKYYYFYKNNSFHFDCWDEMHALNRRKSKKYAPYEEIFTICMLELFERDFRFMAAVDQVTDEIKLLQEMLTTKMQVRDSLFNKSPFKIADE